MKREQRRSPYLGAGESSSSLSCRRRECCLFALGGRSRLPGSTAAGCRRRGRSPAMEGDVAATGGSTR